ncbi:hypothetical protein D3C81_588830 [compost metagenome]
MQGVEGVAWQGDRQQHVLVGDGGQTVSGVFVTALHADGSGVRTKGHQGRGGETGEVDTVAKAQDVDFACRGQASDERFKGVGVVVARRGGQVAAGALELLMQTKRAARAMGKFVAQFVDRRHHLLQRCDQFGLHAAVATEVQCFGQAVDGGG